jgi:hypothetical protein
MRKTANKITAGVTFINRREQTMSRTEASLAAIDIVCDK